MIKDMKGLGLSELLVRMRECAGVNKRVNQLTALVN